jgi:hypothetical protein
MKPAGAEKTGTQTNKGRQKIRGKRERHQETKQLKEGKGNKKLKHTKKGEG